eukprot:TRINITY_DN2605_c0_g1_i15.p1 TRINITY_DN2605_c0_g1~~TRINITY_DN2605_c0_g1_i15.p1  ORF type:complete len:172 (+),score=40.39 TRINITY_DN2605_c0_g1_i15:37-552(+)
MVCFQFVNGVMDILFATCGYMSVKDDDKHNVICLLSYFMVTAINVLFTSVALLMRLVGAPIKQGVPMTNWQLQMQLVVFGLAICTYLAAAIVSYVLIQEAKNNRMVEEHLPILGDGYPPMGPPPYAYAPVHHSHPPPHAHYPPPQSSAPYPSGRHPPGFQPFTGAGYRLGS